MIGSCRFLSLSRQFRFPKYSRIWDTSTIIRFKSSDQKPEETDYMRCKRENAAVQTKKSNIVLDNEECKPKCKSLFSDSVKQECPWEEEAKSQNSKHRNYLVMGVVFAAITAGSLAFILSKQETEKPIVRETVVKITKKKKVEPKKTKKSLHEFPKIPASSKDIPDRVQYLLVGGGTASFSAFRAIKSTDPLAKVLVISDEEYLPYMRPPLSKEVWYGNSKSASQNLVFKQWNGTERSLFYEPDDFYVDCRNVNSSPKGGVAVARGWSIKRIDVVNKIAYLQDDKAIKYEKCLIATGATPKNLELFKRAPPAVQDKVSSYRTIFDFREIEEILRNSSSVAVIGGGFLGSELACSLARKGKDSGLVVYQIFKESGNMGKVLPEYLSLWTTNKMKAEGVRVLSNSEVEAVKLTENERLSLSTSSGEKVDVDYVLVSVGVVPNTELAELSDLEVDPDLGGFLVNAELEARSNLYAAGDCACFYDTKLGRRRVEHHDHAVVSGRLAGENMTGARKPYLHQSMFWSDLGPDIGYEAIGIVDSSLPTVGVFAKASQDDTPQAVVALSNDNIRSETESNVIECAETDTKVRDPLKSCADYGKGVIFYLRDDYVVGILLWNIFNRMSIARQVLKDEKKYEDLNEVAKLFCIHDD